MSDHHSQHRRRDGAGARRRHRHQRRAHPAPPRPHRRRRRRRPRLPARRPRGRARPGCRLRRASRGRRDAEPARRRADRGQGRAGHRGAAHDVRLEDPRGLDPAVRRDRRRQAEGGRTADPGQDQHGRVRDGLLDRALGLRPDPQPVGPRPDPRRLGRWLGRGRGCLRGAARDRHRHGRLDPPARCGHRHGRREADVRRSVPLRPRRARQQPGPGGPGHPDRPRLGDAARHHRRARPARQHLHRPAVAVVHRRGQDRRDRRHDRREDRRHHRAGRGGLAGRRDGALPGVGRPAGQGRRRGRRGLLPELRARAGGLLPDPAGRGVLQPREVRRHALRPARRARGRPERRGRHARHPRRRLRRRGQAPDHPRHLRPLQRLLRRLLRPGPEGAHADQPRLRGRLRAGRRARLADRPDHGLQAGGEARRPDRDVSQRPRDHPRQPGRRPRHLGAERPGRRGRAARRLPDPRARARGRAPLPRRRRARGAARRAVGRPLLDQAPALEGATR